MRSVPAASSTNIVPSAPTDTSDTDNFKNLSPSEKANVLLRQNPNHNPLLGKPTTLSPDAAQAMANFQMFNTDGDPNFAAAVFPSGKPIAGGPAVPFSKTSDSLRNIFAGPDDSSRGSELFTPATISKTKRTSTDPVDTTTGTPGFRDRSASSTTDLESTQTPKTPELNAFEKIAKVTSGFVKKIINALPGQSIDAAGNPIVTTDDDDGGSRDSRNDPTGSDITQTLIDQGKKDLRQDQSVVDYSQTASGKDYDPVAEKDDYDAFEDIGAAFDPDNTEEDDEEPYFSGPQQYIAKGGLIARPKKKVKKKTTNKRGLAARK